MSFSKMLGKIFGIPEGELSAGIENKPTVCEYVPESELHGAIEAAAADDDGTSYIPWRIDDTGEQWYRRVPTIEANAAYDDVMAEADDDFSGDDDDDFSGDDDTDTTGDDDEFDDDDTDDDQA